MSARPATGTKVLLYSGGLDSYILAALYRPDILLHVNLGGRYGDEETRQLRKPAGVDGQQLLFERLDLSPWEDPETLITPGRNAMLVLLAANYGDRIWLGATAGDRTLDKDPEFAGRMSHLLEHMYADQWWLPGGRRVHVELPIKAFTKRELVAKYLEAGLSPSDLVRSTFSCYAPDADGVECGACKPCIRKWVALVVNNVPPLVDASEAARANLESGLFDGRGDERSDVIEALARV